MSEFDENLTTLERGQIINYLVIKYLPVYVVNVNDNKINYRLKFVRDKKIEILDYQRPEVEVDCVQHVTIEQMESDPEFWKSSDRFFTIYGIEEFLNNLGE